MNNGTIAHNFSLLSKLLDIHGDKGFKAKTYASAAYTIDKLPVELSTLAPNSIFALKGIGDSLGKKIIEQLEGGRLIDLDALLVKTPTGIVEMMKIKGLGPKKIATIWKELEIESIGELLYACNENRLCLFKGFGEKTQENIKEAIAFYLSNQGSYLYSQVENYAPEFTTQLQSDFPGQTFLLTGDIRRHAEVIHKLEWVTDVPATALETYFIQSGYETSHADEYLLAKGPGNIALHFYSSPVEGLYQRLFETSGTNIFLEAWLQQFGSSPGSIIKSEEQIFAQADMDFIPPYLRETKEIIDKALNRHLPQVIEPEEIKGIIHTHSKWSDGSQTIEAMARGAIDKGFEYLVISDHSKTASYANGLYPDRIAAQHEQIDELNEKLKPFRIFKSIESDIINDGSLDYDEKVLASFDLVIASVHSNLKMSEERAMSRLMNAIANPYTTILGHMTGRLLLSRNGYPVNYETIIEHCSRNKVVIELNANPRRLDMDWRWIEAAVHKGVLISINPDAHAVEAFDDIRYGVLAAQKGGLTKSHNLSSFSLAEFEAFLQEQKAKRN
jgi:DNA polymerase (family 10)